MKKECIVMLLLSCVYIMNTHAQKLTINDLLVIYSKSDWKEVNAYLSEKGFICYNNKVDEELNQASLRQVSWLHRLNSISDKSVAWCSLHLNGSAFEYVSYTTLLEPNYKAMKEEVKAWGFKDSIRGDTLEKFSNNLYSINFQRISTTIHTNAVPETIVKYVVIISKKGNDNSIKNKDEEPHAALKAKGESEWLKDIDGNMYSTVKIGNQIWMTENLRSTKFNDGTDISLLSAHDAWIKLASPGMCWYDNVPDMSNKYGALYNGYAVETNKLCPVGWKVPTDADWMAISDYYGGKEIVGGKLKATGVVHWAVSDFATNESGFTALGAGIREVFWGDFKYRKETAYFWSSTVDEQNSLWAYSLNDDRGYIYRTPQSNLFGFSVRCIKD